jgi:hypothetical protein
MFGVKRKLETAFAELAASLPPATDLAAGLMPAFGPDGPKGGKDLRRGDLGGWILPRMLPQYEYKLSQQSLKFLRAFARMGTNAQALVMELDGLLEAIQLLEHAELVYESRRTEPNDSPAISYWSATQLGLATLASGKAAVRQRVKDRTGAASAIGPSTVTPPRPSVAQRLQELENLRATSVISDAEYTAKRTQVIGEI